MSPLALDVVTKTGKTPVLGRMLSKYVGRKTSSIENGITKARNHSRQRGNIMRVVFGIDVSKASSSLSVKTGHDAIVLTDKERIIQIGNNLLSNAVKIGRASCRERV